MKAAEKLGFYTILNWGSEPKIPLFYYLHFPDVNKNAWNLLPRLFIHLLQ